MTKQELFESAARKLGPMGCKNALTAFVTGESNSWGSCVLARAYGADNELDNVIPFDRVPPGKRSPRVAVLLGLTTEEVHAVTLAFDIPVAGEREALIAALEAEASKLTPTGDGRSLLAMLPHNPKGNA